MNFMPWKERSYMEERMLFVSRAQNGEKLTDLCREFGISRTTGYKFYDRYKKFGPVGLSDMSRRPHSSPNETHEAVVELIVNTKKERPTWGAAKIREWLIRKNPGVKIPSRFTVHEILNKYDLVQKRTPRIRGTKYFQGPIAQSGNPNEIWCVDFKGQFQLGNKKYCYPLTVSDHRSRYLITCEGLENTKGNGAMPVFEQAFDEYGLPDAILSDNGAPFASTGLFGLTKLSVWWLKLGIKLHRIEPGHPEQNGRHERMHLTLKQETARPAGDNFLQQQEKFDEFRQCFNMERPYEALDMKCPGEFYQPSTRKLPKQIIEPTYPLHDATKIVGATGKLYIQKGSEFELGQAFSNEKVGIREEDIGLWKVTFMNMDLGLYDSYERKFKPFVNILSSGGHQPV